MIGKLSSIDDDDDDDADDGSMMMMLCVALATLSLAALIVSYEYGILFLMVL